MKLKSNDNKYCHLIAEAEFQCTQPNHTISMTDFMRYPSGDSSFEQKRNNTLRSIHELILK